MAASKILRMYIFLHETLLCDLERLLSAGEEIDCIPENKIINLKWLDSIETIQAICILEQNFHKVKTTLNELLQGLEFSIYPNDVSSKL